MQVEYETVWTGATGWTDQPSARGALLPDYPTQTAPVFQDRAARNRALHPQDSEPTGQFSCKYSETTRAAVQAAYAGGELTLAKVAQRYAMPLSTVYNIVRRKRVR